jgi:hypothetical protein
MNVEIGAEAAQFPEKEYINGIAVTVHISSIGPGKFFEKPSMLSRTVSNGLWCASFQETVIPWMKHQSMFQSSKTKRRIERTLQYIDKRNETDTKVSPLSLLLFLLPALQVNVYPFKLNVHGDGGGGGGGGGRKQKKTKDEGKI